MERPKVAEAYARLVALKSNLPEQTSVRAEYAQEFEAILDLLQETSGYDLRSFRVPPTEIKPRVTSSGPHGVTYSKKPFCERSLLMMKIDGVLTFFKIQESTQKTTIGFSPPQV